MVTRLVKAQLDHSNRSMSNLQEERLRGVEISFLPFRCEECGRNETPCVLNFNENIIKCEAVVHFYNDLEDHTRNGKNCSRYY